MPEEKPDLSNQQSDAEKSAALKAAAETSKTTEQSATTSKANEQSSSDAELKAELEREKAENARLKEFERGTQEKLRRLAEIERTEQVKATQTPDEITEIDSQIVELDKAIYAHKNHRNELGDPDPLYAGHLEIQKRGLERDKTRTLKSRDEVAFQGKYARVSEDHPEFTDFNGLNKVIVEYKNKYGEVISPLVAYDIYDERQKAKAVSQSAQITAESKQLGDKAVGQGGGKPAAKADEPSTGEKERKRLFGV